MNYDFITIGGATEDITFYTREGLLIDNKEDILRQKLLAFEYGAKLKIDKAYSTFGGGAANAAVCLSRLGLNVAALVAVGNDSRGDRIVANFEHHKVKTELVERIKDFESGFSFLLVGQNNEHVVFSNRAANKKLFIGNKEIKKINKAKWVYMTSLSGAWRTVLKNVFRSEAKIAWNPGHIQLHTGKAVIGRYLQKTAMLTINKDEAIELVVSDKKYRNKNNRFLNNIKNLLQVIKEWGPKIVVITNGKYGADAYDGASFYHQDIIKENRRVDTTGVGDAFGSTFTAGLEIFNGDIGKAMYLSVTNTASVIGKQGAQNGLISKSAIKKLLQI